MKMAEMAYAFEGRLLIVAHTKAAPGEIWNAYVRDASAHASRHWQSAEPRILVFSDGGGPDVVQRKALLNAVPQIRNARGAVLSSSTLVRGIATAFSWFTAGFRVFAPSDLPKALAWLELEKSEESTIPAIIGRLRRELGEDRMRSIPRAI
jgi:hypothetical protein